MTARMILFLNGTVQTSASSPCFAGSAPFDLLLGVSVGLKSAKLMHLRRRQKYGVDSTTQKCAFTRFLSKFAHKSISNKTCHSITVMFNIAIQSRIKFDLTISESSSRPVVLFSSRSRNFSRSCPQSSPCCPLLSSRCRRRIRDVDNSRSVCSSGGSCSHYWSERGWLWRQNWMSICKTFLQI